MNFDSYGEVINGSLTYEKIARELLKTGKCIIGWTDQGYDHRDIMFTWKPTHLGGILQRGLRWTYLFVSIMGYSCMGFLIERRTDNTKHSDYIKEKLHLSDNSCDDKICELINGVISAIDKLEED